MAEHGSTAATPPASGGAQLEFAAGPKIELMTPTGGPDAAFLERFLATRGAGPHHFNFIVTDIEATLARIRALGIEPVQVNLANPYWKEAFLHPRSAHGIVIQVAQQAGSPRVAAPGELPEPGPPALFDLIEHRVGDLSGATRLFREVLDGRLESGDDDTAELTWPAASGSGWCARMACLSAGRYTTSVSPAPTARSAHMTRSARACWPSASA